MSNEMVSGRPANIDWMELPISGVLLAAVLLFLVLEDDDSRDDSVMESSARL